MTIHGEKRRRRHWSAADKRALLDEWQASGLSARQFGQRAGVPPANLLKWRSSSAVPVAARQRPAVRFMPVQVARSEAGHAVEKSAGRAVLEVVLHSGARVRVLDGADVRMVSELVLAVTRGA